MYLSNREKYEVFKDTAQSFGRTGLMLSGGAALGLYHTGVVKAMWECGVLPRIISGSSAGSIIGAMFCTRTDDEIRDLISNLCETLCFDAFEKCETAFDSVKVKLWRLITRGAFMDVSVLAQCLRHNCQDMTFEEAYHRTGRVLNISVSAEKREGDTGLVLNYLTTPDVVIWSAVCASCALKGMFASVQLMVKDKDNNITPYLEGQLWSDGSVPHDIPVKRLAQLFNVNFCIVSQTNPHVVPFVRPPPSYKRHRGHKEASLLKRAWFGMCTEANRWLKHVYEVGLLPNRVPWNIPLLLSAQTYQGHITILPIGSVMRAVPDFINIVANPTVEHMEFVTSMGARRTWPSINHIRWVTEIERALDRCLNTLNVEHLREIHRRADYTNVSPQLSSLNIQPTVNGGSSVGPSDQSKGEQPCPPSMRRSHSNIEGSATWTSVDATDCL
jgi:predicted acylesterase/phospholipase RssA